MIPVAWLGAYWLRVDFGEVPEVYFHQALVGLTVVVPLQAAVNWHFGLYRGVWRFASLPDLIRISKNTQVLKNLMITC